MSAITCTNLSNATIGIDNFIFAGYPIELYYVGVTTNNYLTLYYTNNSGNQHEVLYYNNSSSITSTLITYLVPSIYDNTTHDNILYNVQNYFFLSQSNRNRKYYKIIRYYTDLNITPITIDLNTYTSTEDDFKILWISEDFDTVSNLENDIGPNIYLSTDKNNWLYLTRVSYNQYLIDTTLTNSNFYKIPSGNYYLKVDFDYTDTSKIFNDNVVNGFTLNPLITTSTFSFTTGYINELVPNNYFTYNDGVFTVIAGTTIYIGIKTKNNGYLGDKYTITTSLETIDNVYFNINLYDFTFNTSYTFGNNYTMTVTNMDVSSHPYANAIFYVSGIDITSDLTEYTFISQVKANIYMYSIFSDTFTIKLCSENNGIVSSIVLTSSFTSDTNSTSYVFYPYNITDIQNKLDDSYLYLDKDVYLEIDFNSYTYTYKSSSFKISSNYFTLSTDYSEYTIISDITTLITFNPITTTYYDSEDTFTVTINNVTDAIVTDLSVKSTVSNQLSNKWYPYEIKDNTGNYLLGSITITATSNTYNISNQYTFTINSNYFSSDSTYNSTYLTIAPIPTTLNYVVTTTTHFVDTVTITSGSYSIEKIQVDVNNSYTYTLYPYLYFKYDSDITTSHTLTFTSLCSYITTSSFSLNPNSIYSLTNGNFSVLVPVEIVWFQTIASIYNVYKDSFYLKLEDGSFIANYVNTPYVWEPYTTSYFGTLVITIRSTNYLIYNTFTITIVNASAADYGVLENKKLGVAPCSSISLTPVFARATSNNICLTNKKNNIATTTIKLGNRTYVVPCRIVDYLPELKILITKMTIRNALLFLIKKYNIVISTTQVQNVKRYQYPTANAKIIYPILQYNTSFRLGDSIIGTHLITNTKFVEKVNDARILEICNDDTKTFSTYYTDMLKNATYWLSTLPSFKDGSYTYCIIRPTNGTLKKVITGSITLRGNVLVFTPIILKALLFFYQPYSNIDITIAYTNTDVSGILTYIQQNYFQDSVVLHSSCL